MNTRNTVLLVMGLIIGVVLGLLIMAGGSFSGIGNIVSGERHQIPVVGKTTADFELSTLSGGSVRLSKTRGKPTIVNFWATWCGPCREEMPILQTYFEKYTGKVTFLAVNSLEDSATVGSFISENGYTIPVVLDITGSITDDYNIRGFPTTFFLDQDGILRDMHVGQLNEVLLDQYIQTIGVTP